MTRPTRADVLTACLEGAPLEACVVVSNGFLAREVWARRPAPNTFPMLGSMGLAAAIALGIALERPECPVLCLEGDGNALMGMAVLPMVGDCAPANLLHVVLDDGAYSSTGGQPVPGPAVTSPELAIACGYAWAIVVDGGDNLLANGRVWWQRPGPGHVRVLTSPEPTTSAPRVTPSPSQVAVNVARWFNRPSPTAGARVRG